MGKPFFKRLIIFGCGKDFICGFIQFFLVCISVIRIIRNIVVIADSAPDKINCGIRAHVV